LDPLSPKKNARRAGAGGALLCTLHRRMAHAWPRRRHAPMGLAGSRATATAAKNWLRGRQGKSGLRGR
jgi:hypothetical protein